MKTLRGAWEREERREEQVERLSKALASADNVVVGAGAGLSTAAGFTYSGPRFEESFSDFEARYGFHDMYAGGFYPYATLEETWAFWSRYVWVNRYTPAPKDTYAKLLRLLDGKDYFVLTTNVDHQFQKAGFAKERLFYTQGDYGLFQCSKPCHQRTYDNYEQIRAMRAAERDMRVPSELVPRCPVCGEPMSMNLRSDDTFVEDEGWHAAAARYDAYLHEHAGLRTLYLELGVGMNTPGIIKFPFWSMTNANPDATYASVNFGEATTHPAIRDRSILVQGDVDAVLGELLEGAGGAGE